MISSSVFAGMYGYGFQRYQPPSYMKCRYDSSALAFVDRLISYQLQYGVNHIKDAADEASENDWHQVAYDFLDFWIDEDMPSCASSLLQYFPYSFSKAMDGIFYGGYCYRGDSPCLQQVQWSLVNGRCIPISEIGVVEDIVYKMLHLQAARNKINEALEEASFGEWDGAAEDFLEGYCAYRGQGSSSWDGVIIRTPYLPVPILWPSPNECGDFLNDGTIQGHKTLLKHFPYALRVAAKLTGNFEGELPTYDGRPIEISDPKMDIAPSYPEMHSIPWSQNGEKLECSYELTDTALIDFLIEYQNREGRDWLEDAVYDAMDRQFDKAIFSLLDFWTDRNQPEVAKLLLRYAPYAFSVAIEKVGMKDLCAENIAACLREPLWQLGKEGKCVPDDEIKEVEKLVAYIAEHSVRGRWSLNDSIEHASLKEWDSAANDLLLSYCYAVDKWYTEWFSPACIGTADVVLVMKKLLTHFPAAFRKAAEVTGNFRGDEPYYEGQRIVLPDPKMTHELQTNDNNEIVILDPKINGYALDNCREWSRNCGKPAADSYCRSKGYGSAISFLLQENTPPTIIFNGGDICTGYFCDRISLVKCQRY